MFTVENDTSSGEGCTVWTIDETNLYDEVEVILSDDSVYIRQSDENLENLNMIVMSAQQMKDIVRAYYGAFYLPSGGCHGG